MNWLKVELQLACHGSADFAECKFPVSVTKSAVNTEKHRLELAIISARVAKRSSLWTTVFHRIRLTSRSILSELPATGIAKLVLRARPVPVDPPALRILWNSIDRAAETHLVPVWPVPTSSVRRLRLCEPMSRLFAIPGILFRWSLLPDGLTEKTAGS